jgi:hypothetical protein
MPVLIGHYPLDETNMLYGQHDEDCLLCDDLQLRVASFLKLSDAKSFMITEKQSFELIKKDAVLWSAWCRQQWPHIPLGTALVNECPDYCRLWSLAAPGPTSMDISSTYMAYVRPIFRRTSTTAIQCVQDDRNFYRSFGIRSDKPLPCSPDGSPFVCPYVSDEKGIDLTPRYVAYFEITIVDNSKNVTFQESEEDEPSVGIGLSLPQPCLYPVRCNCGGRCGYMPGWDSLSYGYHSDTGSIYHNSKRSLRRVGPTFGRGDTVGCGVDYSRGNIFFTLNGKLLGTAWEGLDLKAKTLFPTLGVSADATSHIDCNFGQRSFLFDFSAFE